jgi:hypothetical protein
LNVASTASLFSGIVSDSAFSFLGCIGNPLLHKLGDVVFTNDALVGVWAALYRWPVAPWARVNNTVIMGGVIASLILA